MVLAFIVSLLALAGAGAIYEVVGAARSRRRFPVPGRLVQIGRHKLHIVCAGAGRPAVILESGIAASSLSWTVVQRAIAQFTRVCSYDRAGFGWSDAAREPRTSANLVVELHRLLKAERVPLPCVLVGHSFGGLLVTAFAHAYPAAVAGLVLVDPVDPREWLRETPGVRRLLLGAVFFSRLGGVLARLGLVRLLLGLLMGGWPDVPRRVIRLFGPDVTRKLHHIVGEVQKLPPEIRPTVAAIWCQPKCFATMARHLSALPTGAEAMIRIGTLGDTPLTVISAGDAPPSRVAWHSELARMSTRGRLTMARRSGHWILFDQPEIVVNAVRDHVAEYQTM